jgi:hypothetical protein
MGDLDVVHGLFTMGKPELFRAVYNVCILAWRKKWILSELVQYYCGTLLNKKPLFWSLQGT